MKHSRENQKLKFYRSYSQINITTVMKSLLSHVASVSEYDATTDIIKESIV